MALTGWIMLGLVGEAGDRQVLRMGERRRRTGPASLQSVRAGSKSGKDIRVSFSAFVILQGVFFYFFLFLSNVASDDAGEPVMLKVPLLFMPMSGGGAKGVWCWRGSRGRG